MNHYQMLRTVSRTFALSIEQLPGLLRESVTIAYLLFRVADALEDHAALAASRKAELLRLWADVINGAHPAETLLHEISALDGNDPETSVAKHADLLIEKLGALHAELRKMIIRHVSATAQGMARWQDLGPTIATEESMNDYMHQVAGRVGYLLTELFAWYAPSIRTHRERLMPLGQEFGLALQTVNIIRGLRKDYDRGWVFVPASFYEKAGLTREGLFDPHNTHTALKVVDMLADKAERHLYSALLYIRLLPRAQHRIRLFCIWPLLFAVKTLAVSRNNPAVLNAEVKISRTDVSRIMRTARIFCWSNFMLTTYYNRLFRIDS